MNIPNLIRIFWAAWFLIVGSGCATVPTKPDYQPYTMEVFPPKSADYSIPVLFERPNRDFIFIGRFSCFDPHFYPDELMVAAKAKARKVGADAILVSEIRCYSMAYSKEIRKSDPSTPPSPPDKKNSNTKEDRVTDHPPDYSQNTHTPNWHTETVTGIADVLAFDVGFIAYKDLKKPTPAQTIKSPSVSPSL